MPRPPRWRPIISNEIRKATPAGGIVVSELKELPELKDCGIAQLYKDVKKLEEAGEVERVGKGATGGDLLVWVGGEGTTTVDARLHQATNGGGKGDGRGGRYERISKRTRTVEPVGGLGELTGTGEVVGLGGTYRVVALGLRDDGGTEIRLESDDGQILVVNVEGRGGLIERGSDLVEV